AVRMYGNFSIADAEDTDPNNRLRSPAGVAAMNAYIIAVRHDQTGLVFEVRRQVSQKSLDRRRAVRNLRIVLAIVGGKEAVDDCGIAVDKNAPDPLENQRLVRIRGI